MRSITSLRLWIALFGLGLFLLPFNTFAQVGPCPSSGVCPSGETCIEPPSGTSQCFKICVVGSSTPSESCPSGQSCSTPPGRTDPICMTEAAAAEFTGAAKTAVEPTAGSEGSETSAAPFTSVTPKLNVQIPGVTLSPATKEGSYVYIPFLAQYISGAYRYAVGIVLVIAIIMVAWGGFRYLIGSGFEDITRGKEIIRDAIAGMLIVIGAYMILQTINPSTLDLSVLKLGLVTEEAIFESQRTTIVETRPDGSYPDAPAESFGSCPLVLSAAVEDQSARRTEYLEKVATIVGDGDIRQRVLRVAEASAKCGVSLGSCGKTAEVIFDSAGHDYRDRRGRQTQREVSGVSGYLDSIKCARGLERDARIECKRNAKELAYARMASTISGWPEAWTNTLEPGDRIVIFNANSSIAGLHSAIFMGWAGSGRARVVQGAWHRLVNEGTICLTTACEGPSPLIRVFQPVDE